jgi:hypothetical protein
MMGVKWKFAETNLSKRRIRLLFADFLPPTLCDPSLRLQVVRERNNLRIIRPLDIVLWPVGCSFELISNSLQFLVDDQNLL